MYVAHFPIHQDVHLADGIPCLDYRIEVNVDEQVMGHRLLWVYAQEWYG